MIDCPDLKFGKYNTSAQYISQVDEICEQHPNNICCLIVESGMSVGGVILPPQGYLSTIFEKVREHNGVCICDEVQVGFGRFGDHYWAFQQQNVIPDIVTMGKPFGNGMPLAAVVTTPTIAAAFAKGPEWFNTFGGNPVSAAAGLAVMHEISNGGLQENARVTGAYWRERLIDICKVFPEMAVEVRGRGFFVGFHLVSARLASHLVGRLKNEFRILCSVDGPGDNVLVFKPPMCFSKEDVDELVGAITKMFKETDLTELNEKEYSHCPT